MPAIHDSVFDDGLSILNSTAENLYICNADPGLTWSNIGTMAIGTKATPTVSVPEDRIAGGRQVTISAITDGDVDATDDATHWALTDDSEEVILVSGELSDTQAVTEGNVFTLTAITIGIPDPE